MSALTQDWAPGVTPGAQPFENTVDALTLADVHFAPEQLDWLQMGSVYRPWPGSRSSKMYALFTLLLPDPVWPHAEAMGLPAMTLNEETMDLEPVLVPAVAEIDCSEYEHFDETEPEWRRFPSLLGRPHIYSVHSDTWLYDALQPIRLWNIWPLDADDVDLVNEATKDWINDQWKPYLKWLEVRDNSEVPTACDYEGTPPELHDHQRDEYGRLYDCLHGDEWFEWYANTHMTTDPDGDPYPKPFTPVGGLYHLGDAWEQLLQSSRANTHAALSAYPPWKREEVARTERHYSPWLWSS